LSRIAVLSLLALLVPAAAARAAGDPIMPLDQVTPGMRCTGYSVVQGTTISPFAVDVIDVVSDSSGEGARILFSVSGPAVDATGIGPDFSGSPIYCPGAGGQLLNAGAISEGIGQYGNNVGLATPIQEILAEPVVPPSSTVRAPALLRMAEPISEPLSISGISTPLADAMQRAARSVDRVIYTAPAAPRNAATFGVQRLVPGASVAAGYSSGAIAAGAIGTVAYTDGDRVWAFGHDLAGAGRRDLFLQDAYVYTVIDNPIGSSDSNSYKLAAPGHDVGTLSDDTPNAVAGTIGALPAHFPLHVVAHDLDAHRTVTLDSQVADESSIGDPEGQSALSLVGPAAVAQASFDILDGAPASQSGSMCVSIAIRESPKRPLRFCNDYVGGSPGDNGIAGSPLVSDMASAISDLDAYDLSPIHIARVDVSLSLRRELDQALIVSARAPKVVRRGATVAVRLALRAPRGGPLTRTVRVRVPRDERTGHRDIVLTGAAADVSGPAPSTSSITVDLGLSSDDSGDEGGPTTIAQLREEVAATHRATGLNAVLRGHGVSHGSIGPEVYNDPRLRLTGTLAVPVTVKR
jgi:hypothetical protein